MREVVLAERVAPGGRARFRVVAGEQPADKHLRALVWLLDEHPRPTSPPGSSETTVVLAIARTEMAGGRVGHTYALDGRALGDPRAHDARGVVWRWIEQTLPS